MEESSVVREWLNQLRDEGLNLGRDEGLNLGRDEGLKLGRDEVLNPLRSQILTTIQRRFQVSVTPDVSDTVKAQIDPIVIYRWACLADDAPDLASFRTGLGLK